MRKWIDIVTEQTMRTGNMFSPTIKRDFEAWSAEISRFKLVADMDGDEYHIYRYDNEEDHSSVFLILSKETSVAYFRVVFKGSQAELIFAYVDAAYRGKHLTEMFCWYLKSRLSMSILMSEHQSNDAQALINSLYRSKRFAMGWQKGNERIKYDPSVTGPDNGMVDDLGDPETFYSDFEPTGWRIVLECGKFPKQPAFTPRFPDMVTAGVFYSNLFE